MPRICFAIINACDEFFDGKKKKKFALNEIIIILYSF